MNFLKNLIPADGFRCAGGASGGTGFFLWIYSCVLLMLLLHIWALCLLGRMVLADKSMYQPEWCTWPSKQICILFNQFAPKKKCNEDGTTDGRSMVKSTPGPSGNAVGGSNEALPCKCSFCDRAFKSQRGLSQHQRKAHPENYHAAKVSSLESIEPIKNMDWGRCGATCQSWSSIGLR